MVLSFALLLAGAALLAFAMAVNANYHPVAPPGERIMFRWWVDIPMPVGAGLVIIGGAVAWWSIIRVRPPGRTGRWGFWLGVGSALINPVVVLPTYLIWWAIVDEMPGDWGTPFEFLWLGMCIAAMALGIASARRDHERRGLLLIPAVIGAFVLTFVLAEVLVPH